VPRALAWLPPDEEPARSPILLPSSPSWSSPWSCAAHSRRAPSTRLGHMRRPRLIRRRSMLVPTWTGLILLAALLVGGAFWARQRIPLFLAPNQPVGHGLLVVEGWQERDSLQVAASAFRNGGYDAIVVTGGPTTDPAWEGGFATYAERAASELRRLGIAEPELVVVPAPASAQDRTYLSAVSVRQWMEGSGRPVSALDVFSVGPHSRRSQRLYRMAFGDQIEVGVRSGSPSTYELGRWWQSSEGTKDVLGESLAYAWVLCCFHPRIR
jgi:hypothetical protein